MIRLELALARPNWLGIDNPGGEWLDRAKEKSAEHRTGTAKNPTAYTKRPILLEVEKLIDAPGANGEHNSRLERRSTGKLARITEGVEKSGKFDTLRYPVLVGIDYRGQPVIFEGNHRTAYAYLNGVKGVWANVQWYAGSEVIEGEWSPQMLDAFHRHWATFPDKEYAKMEVPAIPQAVKDAAVRGLELRAEHGRGGTEVGVARARDLKNGAVSWSTVKRMKAYFDRHEVDKQGEGWGKDSAGYIAWLLWGGDPGRTWATKALTTLEKAALIEDLPMTKLQELGERATARLEVAGGNVGLSGGKGKSKPGKMDTDELYDELLNALDSPNGPLMMLADSVARGKPDIVGALAEMEKEFKTWVRRTVSLTK